MTNKPILNRQLRIPHYRGEQEKDNIETKPLPAEFVIENNAFKYKDLWSHMESKKPRHNKVYKEKLISAGVRHCVKGKRNY